MHTVIEGIQATFRNLNTWQQRVRLRRTLLRWNDQKLKDLGFSRRLLAQGVQAWPWQETAEIEPLRAISRPSKPLVDKKAEIARAIAELKALSQGELAPAV